MENRKEPTFRYIYANGISMGFTGAEMMLKFGIREDPTKEHLLEQIGVVMTPTTAKLLSYLLARTISAIESSGEIIPLEEEKIKAIEEAMSSAEDAARLKRDAASASNA